MKSFAVYLIILASALALFYNYFTNAQTQIAEKGIYYVLADAKAGKIEKIEAQSESNEILITYKEAPTVEIRSRVETNDSITVLLMQAGVPLGNIDVTVAPKPFWSGLLNIFSTFLPVLLMIGFFIFFLGSAQTR